MFPGGNAVTTAPIVATPLGKGWEPTAPVKAYFFFFAPAVRASVPSPVRQYELVGAKIALVVRCSRRVGVWRLSCHSWQNRQ